MWSLRSPPALLQKAHAIYLEETRKAGLYGRLLRVRDAPAGLDPGVMVDLRTYKNVCRFRADTSTDGMTADLFEFPLVYPGPDGPSHPPPGKILPAR